MPKTKTTVPTKCQGDGCEEERRPKSRFCSVTCYFWSRFDRSGGPNSCWIWTGSVNPQTGYGDVSDHTAGGKRISAHRHAYRLAKGDPGELSVLHRCDMRLCGNPAHLFLGTHRDNWLDAIAKGRRMITGPGEANAAAKLTTEEVLAIRRSTARVADLVWQYGVNDSTIRRVLSGRNWRHVPDEEPEVIYLRGVMDRPAPVMQRSA
jgi:hypothetical protein